MFVHIRRHQKWLWIFISAAVIISFVWYFNPNQQMGTGAATDAGSIVGTIYGDPISMANYSDARREAILHYWFSYGDWPGNDEFTRQMRPIERETRNRLFLVRKLTDYNIEVDDKAVADWIASTFKDRQTGQFHYPVVERFLQIIREQQGFREQDFERYVRHQVGIQHLAAIAGAPGKLVTPQAVKRAFLQEHEKIDTKVVLLPLSNFVAKVNVTPEAIATYYTNSMARYRLPERVQLSYIGFPASNYFPQAEQRLSTETNLNQQIDAVYLERGAQFYTDATGQPLAPEAAKQRIREEIRMNLARNEALKAAYEVAGGFEEMQINPNNPNPAEPLENIAAAKGLNVQVTQPFSQFAGPQDINVPEQFTRLAFQLTPQAPVVQEPIMGEDAVYLVAFNRKIPSELQPLETVRETVTEDFKRGEAFRLAREAANAFMTAATNALASGGNVEAVAQEQGLTVTNLPPILRESTEETLNLPPMVDAGALRSAVMELNEGELSTYTPTRDGGFIAYVESISPPSEEEIKAELPEFAEAYRRRNSVEAFNDWFSKEMQLARLTLAGEEENQAVPQ